MKRSSARILTTHVGSLPCPKDLTDMIFTGAKTRARGQRAAHAARVETVVGEVVDQQIAAGVDVVSDGARPKIGFVNHVKDGLNGFDGQATTFVAAGLMDYPRPGVGGGAAVAAQHAPGSDHSTRH